MEDNFPVLYRQATSNTKDHFDIATSKHNVITYKDMWTKKVQRSPDKRTDCHKMPTY